MKKEIKETLTAVLFWASLPNFCYNSRNLLSILYPRQPYPRVMTVHVHFSLFIVSISGMRGKTFPVGSIFVHILISVLFNVSFAGFSPLSFSSFILFFRVLFSCKLQYNLYARSLQLRGCQPFPVINIVCIVLPVCYCIWNTHTFRESTN